MCCTIKTGKREETGKSSVHVDGNYLCISIVQTTFMYNSRGHASLSSHNNNEQHNCHLPTPAYFDCEGKNTNTVRNTEIEVPAIQFNSAFWCRYELKQ